MDQGIRNKIPPLVTEIRAMEWKFWFPLVANALLALYTYGITGGWGSHLELQDIKFSLGIGSIPLIVFWVVGVYQDLVEAEGREVLLCLPFNHFEFGLLRLLRISVLYIVVIWGVFAILLGCVEQVNYQEFLFPVLLVMFFSSVSFAVILATKNSLITYTFVGVLSSAEYMTRGGITGWVYPFEWSLPKPGVDVQNVVLALAISTVLLLVVGQWLLTKKEYLVK